MTYKYSRQKKNSIYILFSSIPLSDLKAIFEGLQTIFALSIEENITCKFHK